MCFLALVGSKLYSFNDNPWSQWMVLVAQVELEIESLLW